MVSDKEEDYLEAILFSSSDGPAGAKDVREMLCVEGSTVTEMFKRLEDKGLVNYEKYHGAELTERGEKLAKEVSEKHRFLVRFLKSIGVPPERAEVEACGMEHVLSADTIGSIRSFAADVIDDFERVEK